MKKYYSTLTDRVYDTEEALTQAESEHEAKVKERADKEATRAKRAAEVEEAYKKASQAIEEANSLNARGKVLIFMLNE